MSLQLVFAKPSDMHEIRRVQKEVWLETYPNAEYGVTRLDIEDRFSKDDTPEGREQMKEREKRFFQPNARTWVAKDGDTIIGYCLAIKDGEQHCVQALYVLPTYQKKGLGKLLLQHALEWLGTEKSVSLHVASYNESAIQFYTHMGFVKAQTSTTEETIHFPSGATIREIEMILKSQ
jgi:ribosomal protein S18 acetylase RimI-like enzyme